MSQQFLIPSLLMFATGCSAIVGFGDVRFEGSDGSVGDAMTRRDAGSVPIDGGQTNDGGADAGRVAQDAGLDGGLDPVDAGPLDAGVDAGMMCMGTARATRPTLAEFIMPTATDSGLASAQSFTVMGEIVLDNVTGLEWQRGHATTLLTYSEAIGYCETLIAGGCADWRLPEMIELVSITAADRTRPAVDPVVFPGPSALFWSRTESTTAENAWVVSFAYSDANQELVTADWQARCVRDTVSRGVHMVTATSNVVSDDGTNLMWERNPSSMMIGHAAAVSYCDGLTLDAMNDWRMPTRNELLTIVNTEARSPAIDTTRFGYPSSINFWWSSTIDTSSDNPWFSAFQEGGVTFADPITAAGIRCVRS